MMRKAAAIRVDYSLHLHLQNRSPTGTPRRGRDRSRGGERRKVKYKSRNCVIITFQPTERDNMAVLDPGPDLQKKNPKIILR